MVTKSSRRVWSRSAKQLSNQRRSAGFIGPQVPAYAERAAATAWSTSERHRAAPPPGQAGGRVDVLVHTAAAAVEVLGPDPARRGTGNSFAAARGERRRQREWDESR
jgi:hypothetical protein